MSQSKKNYDVAIVGAGAAGLMTAIFARKLGLCVLLLDGRGKIGAKIIMSGGTRCNLTNQKVTDGDYCSNELHYVRAALKAFTPIQTMEFFEEIGIDLILEPSGKYFPSTNSSNSVLQALLRQVDVEGIFLKTPCKVRSIISDNDGLFQVKGENFEFIAKSVVLTTGGLSFPSTGSDGVGYSIAKKMGHTLVKTTPSLTPLTIKDQDWKSLSGISLQAEVVFKEDGKKVKACKGDMLFTHFGLSGPVILDISRYWIRRKEGSKSSLIINFLPEFKQDEFAATLIKKCKTEPHLSIKKLTQQYFPKRFVDVFLKKIGVDQDILLTQLIKEYRNDIVQNIFSYKMQIAGDMGYQKAEVTAGGVDLKEINKSDFQSKLQKGLFFAGEILDVDGRIGGFNFQWAWSSGVVAARGVKKYLSSFVAKN